MTTIARRQRSNGIAWTRHTQPAEAEKGLQVGATDSIANDAVAAQAVVATLRHLNLR